MSVRSECRKFAPNIFNKTKCTNCFRQKEEHTAEALESNRATRKIAKCGYLFVAPGWDFTNPVNRTKRWQRRWFVLFDDGEFSYALDEHPETLPQASIDMNKVIEVSNAEELTGNAFSLAITAPDYVHFVKGTSREEIRCWSDVLSVFPRSKGRHKRNATFPGTNQPSSHCLLQTPIRGGSLSSGKGLESVGLYNSRLSSETSSALWQPEDVYPTRERDTNLSSHQVTTPLSIDTTDSSPQRKVVMGSPPTRDKDNSPDKHTRLRRSTVISAPIHNTKSNKPGQRSYTEDLSKIMSPCWQDDNNVPVDQSQGHCEVSRRLLLEEYESECKLKDIADTLTRSRNISVLHQPGSDSDAHKQIRGDPDGCGLDVSLRYSPSDLRVELPSEDLLNIKKGWLMKQNQDKEWTKHWFVLRGTGLLYYRDPCSEDQAILDGVIDLSGVTAVSDSPVQRNYGFQICTWDEKRYVLSAVTSGIRANWMSALRKSAGLPQETQIQLTPSIQESNDTGMSRLLVLSSDDEYRTASENSTGICRRESGEWGEALPPSPPLNRTPMSRVKERARGVSKLRVYGSNNNNNNTKRSRSSPPSSRRSTLDSISSSDLIPTSLSSTSPSSGCHNVSGLPVSPASPATLPLPLPLNSCLSTDNKITCEMEEIKHELNLRLRELNNAQGELMRQRQRQQDITHLEKLVEELSKRAEESGVQRARDAAELECLKKRYIEEKLAWENSGRAVESELEASAARCASLRSELETSRDTASNLSSRLSELEERLDTARRENESLYARLTALDNKSNSPLPPSRSRSLDSLSDLTNIDLDVEDIYQLDKDRLIEEYVDVRARFEKAVSEIRAMKRELREAHAQADWLELSLVSTRQEMTSREQTCESSNNLMAARIQDLATKLVQSEKQIRTLKMKLSKTETREKRRSLSLKGRESFTISKEVEDKLAELETRVMSMENKGLLSETTLQSDVNWTKAQSSKEDKKDGLSLRLRRKSLDSATASEPIKVLLRLNSLEAKLVGRSSGEATNKTCAASSVPTSNKQHNELKLFSGDEMDSTQSQIVDQVKKMENLLRAKLVVLAKKRESLMSSGQWNEETRLHLLAEKLAYESVLVSRLHEAVTQGNSNLDTTDAHRLINGLDRKISGNVCEGKTQDKAASPIETSLDYLVRELAKHLSQQSVKRINRKTCSTKSERRKRDPTINNLINKKAIVDAKVVNYLNETVKDIGEALAVESLCDSIQSPDRDHDDNKTSTHLYEETVWNLAREAVDKELVQEEIVRVLSDCTQHYQKSIDEENGSRFLCLVQDRQDLELWASTSTHMLQTNMTEALQRINQEYSIKLKKLKEDGGMPKIVDELYHKRTKEMLNKLADIIAHKSLLDARISVMTSKDMTGDSYEDRAASGPTPSQETSLLSEIQYLYVKFCRDLTQESRDKQKIDLLVDRLSEEISRLENTLVGDKRLLSDNQTNLSLGTDSGDQWYESISARFQIMRERLSNMQKYASCIDCSECDKCKHMHSEISRIENDYSYKIVNIERRQEEEMMELKKEFDKQREQLIRRHKEEEDLLLKNNSELERELESLSCQYNDHMKNMSKSNEGSSSDRTYLLGLSSVPPQTGDSLHLRYQKEIQHLRSVCEKGLIGMENSHKRQIEELQEKHERELESLRCEKEQALAEETHATLAALDAMRKAHEAEVQKEITKFKSEFLNKMQSSHDLNLIHKQHQAEMSEIKTEILSLSEKYSVKCVENASLEDKLRSTNQQLAMAHQHIITLDNRCKQLRLQLSRGKDDGGGSVSPVSSLHPHSHGEQKGQLTSRPRVVHFIPKYISGRNRSTTDSKSSITGAGKTLEPPPLAQSEVERCPEKFSLSGMVSKRCKEFERLLAAPTTCSPTSRV